MTNLHPNKPQQLLRVEEVAELLGITSRTIYRWLHAGKITAKKVGRSWRIPHQVVAELLGQNIDTEALPAQKAPPHLEPGEHFLALAPEGEAIPGIMARLAEIGLQHQHRVYAGCWSYAPDTLRSVMRIMGMPSDRLEAEGTLTISDFNAAYEENEAGGVLDEWAKVVAESQQSNKPIMAIGAPSLTCWDDDSSQLIDFEANLGEMLQNSDATSICVYPLSEFVPNNFRRLGTLISKHTGILLWSETELMLFRPNEFSQLFAISDLAH